MFKLTGYDKDNDQTLCYGRSEQITKLMETGRKLKTALDRDALKNPENGEPIDWLEITPEDDPDLIYWASYPTPVVPTMRSQLQNERRMETILAKDSRDTNKEPIVIPCEILSTDPCFDLKTAAKNAVMTYLCTPNGKQLYEENDRRFGWKEFRDYVPDAFCSMHGFQKLNNRKTAQTDIYEHIVDDGELDDFWNKNE